MSLIHDLQKIGLSDKEAKVYLAALELGDVPVQNISKKAGVNRATTYVVLESLAKKGLCSKYDKAGKTMYVANRPEAIAGIFELQRNEIEERRRYFDAIIAQLKSVTNKGSDKPVIRFFEGKEGIRNAHDEFVEGHNDPKEIVRMFFPKDRIDEVFTPAELSEFRSVRLKHKIKSKALYSSKLKTLPDSPDGQRIKVTDKFPVSCDVAIYGDTTRIASLGDKLSAVLIKDKEIANTFKSLFDLAWEAATSKK